MVLSKELSRDVFGFAWSPPPTLTVSQWADEFRAISPEASAEPGQWRTDRAPYQREIMDAISDASVDSVVVMSSAQVGKTEIILNTLGYFIDQEPSPLLVIQPTLAMAQTFSKDRLAPMIRDTACLTSKVREAKTRDSGNTILHKNFAGGRLSIVGANSTTDLAGRPVRVLLCDEVDRYPVSAGSEGDPLALAIKRTANFWNRRLVFVSTPTNQGESRISQAYEQSDKREWCVPCPGCGALNAFDWTRIVYKGLPEPQMTCVACGKRFGETSWKADQMHGCWIAAKPDVTRVRGFHLNAFASPWSSWRELVRDYQDAYANGEEQLKVWWNTALGWPYESQTGSVDAENLESHRERYAAELPDGVLYLTCGVDVQDDRLELEVVGWGLGKESWGICYKVIYGDPVLNEVWQELDDFLAHEFKFKDGFCWKIERVCIDSGGHCTDQVYNFTRGKSRSGVFAIKGEGASGYPSVGARTYVKRKNRRALLLHIGVNALKGDLFSRLRVDKPGAGFCHWPDESQTNSRGYDETYFKGLVSERMVIKRLRGRDVISWETRDKHTRNEPLDCRVYATAALGLTGMNFSSRKRTLSRLRGQQIAEHVVEDVVTQHEPQDAKREEIKRPAARAKVRRRRVLAMPRWW